MNNNDFMNMFDKFDSNNDDKKITDIKNIPSSNSINNSIEIQRDYPKTLFDIKAKLEELRLLRDSVSGKDFSIKDEINELTSYLSEGIHLDEIFYHREIMDSIITLIGPYGFDKDFVLDNLSNMTGKVCPMEFLGTGRAQALRTYIDMDIDFFEYDENGRVVGVPDSKKDFYKYVVTHEFFHKLSSYKNGYDDVMVMGDALLEGFTDMFAHLASGNNTDKSDLYDFPVQVCSMFAEMIGMEKVLDDYINKTGNFPNLKNLFMECNLDESRFSEFRGILDSVISGVSRDKKSGISPSEWGITEKNSSLDFLRDNIIIPYCQNHPDKVEGILDKFNSLFNDMGYSCSREDIKTSQK